jgi:hypothetical protein
MSPEVYQEASELVNSSIESNMRMQEGNYQRCDMDVR